MTRSWISGSYGSCIFGTRNYQTFPGWMYHYIPTHSACGTYFLSILSSIWYCHYFSLCHSDRCAVTPRCGFNVHFSSWLKRPNTRICQLYILILFGNMFVHVFLLLDRLSVLLFGLRPGRALYGSFLKCAICKCARPVCSLHLHPRSRLSTGED